MTGLIEALHQSKPLVLDGAIGTELSRRGFSTDRRGWSSAAALEAADLLAEIHRDYVAAGADLITTNTFRTHRRSLARTTLDARDITIRNVEIARSVAPSFLLGSAGPIEDCYQPENTPSNSALSREHHEHLEFLVESGVDGLLLETLPTAREALVAGALAVKTGLPVFVSLWSKDWLTLGDGQSIVETKTRLYDLGVDVVLCNCFSAIDADATANFDSSTSEMWGAYANVGTMVDGGWQRTEAESPDVYASFALDWISSGACVIGGCCGTTPSHVSSLRQLVDSLTCADDSP